MQNTDGSNDNQNSQSLSSTSSSSFDIAQRLADVRRDKELLQWQGTFRDYFEVVARNPRIAQLSHARVNDMIHAAGVEKINEGARDEITRYKFFADELYGIEEPIARIVEYFKSAAQRLEVRKRILLLMGPVGGGKSTIVTLLKKGLEDYTRSEVGAVYAIKGCPMHEEPLHLIPHELRAEVEKHYGIYIEGDLCPQCRYKLEHEYGGRHEDMPVHRILFAEKERVGIGTFSPSDPKCVTGETILLTTRGMLRFDELQNEICAQQDEFVPFITGVSGMNGIETTSHFYNGGVRETRRLKTRLGYEIEGSTVHPVLVMRESGRGEWTKLEDVKIGDFVALQRGQKLFGQTTRLMPFINAGTQSRGANKALTLPTDITPDLARLLGYIVAEGSLTDTAMWISNGTPRVVDDITQLCEKLFNITPKIYRKQGTYAVSISISSVVLVRWLESVCGITRLAANKRIPRCVAAAPREIFTSFLEGLFWGDGTISARKSLGSNRFKIASASIELARQVQTALLNLGIVAACYKETIKSRFTAYSVVVTGDAVVDLIACIPSLREKCTDAPESLAAKRYRTNFDTLPLMQSPIRDLLTQVAAPARHKYHRYTTQAAWGRNITRRTLANLIQYCESANGKGSATTESLRRHLDENILWLEVQNITEGTARVYDLTVPATHSFCANGFINHNSQDITELTGSIDLSTIGEVGVESDPRAYRFDGELNIANRGMMEFIEILKCVTPQTYLPTEHGLLRVSELAPSLNNERHQDLPFSLKLQTRDGVQSSSHIIYNGKAKTVRVQTRKGYKLEGAPDHRVLVLAATGNLEWRELKELQLTDRMCINRQGFFGVTQAPKLDAYLSKTTAKIEPYLPARLTPELARLIGYFVAEGWYLKGTSGTDDGIGISTQDDEMIADLHRIAESLNLNLKTIHKCRHHLWSRGLAALFHNFGLNGRRAFEKHIPQIIRRSPKPLVADFLRAYFDGDGTATKSCVSCTTASDELAEQLQLMLLNFGIISKRQRCFNEQYQREYSTIIVDSSNIELFNREIGFGLTRKRERSELLGGEPRSMHRDGVPHLNLHWLKLISDLQTSVNFAHAQAKTAYRERKGVRQLIGSRHYAQLWRFINGRAEPCFNTANTLVGALETHAAIPQELREALTTNFFYDQVATIGEGFDDLWDFCVPANHSYIGNGFVNHNCDEKFLYSLLTLSQEQNIKTGRFAMIYADEVILSHTNENEYAAFAGNRKSEALQDRIILVRVPYNLRVSQEEKIYDKLLHQSEVLRNVHIAPNALKVAAMFAVMTRLEEPKRASVDVVKKMKLYDGEDVEGYKSKDVRELKEETVREGMDGISPRYIINRLSGALVRDGVTCINPIDALRAIKDGFEQHTGINAEQRERYLNLISAARKEYDEIAKTEVQRAFVYSFEDMARTLCNNYLDNVEAYCNKERMKDPITEEEIEPDEPLMRSIEEQIGVSENAKNTFRQEILIRISSYARKGKQFEYGSHERLKEAIEKKIFADLKDVVKITTSSKTPDPDQLRRINDVVDRLIKEHGYCPVCANELLTYVGTLMSR